MTGWPGGCQGEGVEKAFFPDKVHRRGRQLGRVLATRYEEVVVDRLYPGKRQLESCLIGLIGEAEEILDLRGEGKEIQNKRENTVLRVDGGGGTEADINWMLSRGYTLMVKLHNAKRTHKLAQSVETWVSDEKVPERQIGWVTQPTPYVLPTRQLAIRHRKRGAKHSDEFGYSVLVVQLVRCHTGRTCWICMHQATPCHRKPCSTHCTSMICEEVRWKRSSRVTSKAWDWLIATSAASMRKRCWSCWVNWRTTLSSGHAIVWPRPIRISSTLAFGAWCGMSFGLKVSSVFDPEGVIVHVALNPRHPCTAAVMRAFGSDYV